MKIVEPVVLKPLRAEWETAKAKIEAIMAPALEAGGGNGKAASRDLGKRFDAARAHAEAARDAFIDRLCALRILDPACGSGNFLYLALQGVKDIEWRAILDCEALGLGMAVPRVGPEILHGIEINPFAAELARTTIWIGDIQWRVKHAISHHPRPLLRKLDSIECRDALLAPDGKGGFVEAEWPKADFIVGNPPFLGGKRMRDRLGDATVEALFKAYDGRVPAEADLVCYWFSKAWEAMQAGRAKRVGLVATNSIRGGANRKVLEPIADAGAIFEAWSDEPWTIEGAAVRVSLVSFARDAGNAKLDGLSVERIHADLTAAKANLIEAVEQMENADLMFQGFKFGGPFEITENSAREMLRAPLNPNGRPNSEVIDCWINGKDIIRRPPRKWCVNFGTDMTEEQAALFAEPFEAVRAAYVAENDKRLKEGTRPLRKREEKKSAAWWIHQRPRKKLLGKLRKLSRWIAIAEVAKHRVAALVDSSFLPSGSVYAIARDDDTAFGILHSRFHEAWSLRLGTSLEDRPRYTPTTTFETFPFPKGLTPNIRAGDYAADPRAQRIAAAAKRLDELRRAWLNPPDLVDIVPEITPTAAPGDAPRRYPDRIVPKTAEAALKLKSRTLTNLYNERPRWLADAHEALDRAVAFAYGWPEAISTEDALARLLALNLERANSQSVA
jgi:type II restriction/modification system DNA methylase subunit YeeA